MTKTAGSAALICVLAWEATPAQDTLIATELLGRPTDHSITLNVVTGFAADAFVKYGIAPGSYAGSSDTVHAAADQPVEVVADKLTADTRYYYRLCYRRSGASSFTERDEHTFHTQRAPGAAFCFLVESDPHMYDKKGADGIFRATLRNEAADSADFLLDIGDTFGDDHNPTTITRDQIRRLHGAMRSYLGLVCHSTPFFFCLGNHEGESGYWLLQNPPDNMAVNATLARQFYYPNPLPNDFYSGNTVSEGNGIGLPANYYAWSWGDALFVVLDAYRGYTANAKPRGWEWTLGKAQYDWLRQTLEGSRARYTFVFAHHVLGETRGGAAVARGFEWGGYEADNRSYTFAEKRPGWAKPIHQLMADNGVQVFFQGHDHLFAKETVDGVVYQEVPMPSDSTYIIGTRDNGKAYTGDTMSSSGHLRVTVAPDKATIDYVRAWVPADTNAARVNGRVAYTYTVVPRGGSAMVKPAPAVSAAAEGIGHAAVRGAGGGLVVGFTLVSGAAVRCEVSGLDGRRVGATAPAYYPAGTHAAVVHVNRACGAGAARRTYLVTVAAAGKSSRTITAAR